MQLLCQQCIGIDLQKHYGDFAARHSVVVAVQLNWEIMFMFLDSATLTEYTDIYTNETAHMSSDVNRPKPMEVSNNASDMYHKHRCRCR